MEHLKSLVLNSTYEPLQFTTAKRAFVLALLGKAEALEYDGFHIRTTSASYRLPTVIKLNRFIKRPFKSYIAFSRKNILRRDNHTCQYCGKRGVELTMDHVHPKALDGESTWENLVTACRKCNLKKGSRTLEESGMRLVRKPGKPNYPYLNHLPENIPESHLACWRKYMPNLAKPTY